MTAMKILAFDTSTESLSIALTDGTRQWHHSGAGGAQASLTLLPMIESLMRQAALRYGELDAIAFGAGPGSFTGLRTACSVAQGLGFAAGVRLLPVDSLLAVAEEARFVHGPAAFVLAALDARMSQLYVARYAFADEQFTQIGDFELIAPNDLAIDAGWRLAGNALPTYADRLPPVAQASHVAALPSAEAMLRLAPALIAAGALVEPEHALPRYVRDKVAQTTAERAAIAAAAASAAVAPPASPTVS